MLLLLLLLLRGVDPPFLRILLLQLLLLRKAGVDIHVGPKRLVGGAAFGGSAIFTLFGKTFISNTLKTSVVPSLRCPVQCTRTF